MVVMAMPMIVAMLTMQTMVAMLTMTITIIKKDKKNIMMMKKNRMMIVMIVQVMKKMAMITCEEFTNSLAVWVATARSNDKLRHPLVLVRLLPHLL